MKKVLVLLGGPRKNGNSDTLCNHFIEGAVVSGHITEKIYLSNYQINFCNACYSCRENNKCIHNDIMDTLLEKMILADIIVMATPVYFYSMSGQMKTMIDRTLPRYTEIRDKDFYFIATAADSKEFIGRTVEALKGFTDCLPNSNVKGVIYGYNAWKIGDINTSNAIREAYQMGKDIQ